MTDYRKPIELLREKLDRIPRLSLGTFPTPARRLAGPRGKSFFLKDDGVCSDLYGGNKVRKLEYLLAQARETGAERLVSFGDADSHNLAALCTFGSLEGFEVKVVVFPFDRHSDLDGCQRILSAPGVRVVVRKRMGTAWISARLSGLSRSDMWVPLGSSSPLTSLGYVRAAMEFCEQIDEGLLPVPEKIFIAFGTGSSVAGLLVGFSLLGFPARVVAVRTVDRFIASARRLRSLVKGTLRILGFPSPSRFARAMERLDRIESSYLGAGFRDRTPESFRAIEFMEERHCRLEPVYTAKAMAALLDELPRHPENKLVFWNTHDQNAG